jgi:hypothetical protein
MTVLRGDHVAASDEFLIQHAAVRLRGLRQLCLRPPVPFVGVTHGLLGAGSEERSEVGVEVEGGKLTFMLRQRERRSDDAELLGDDVVVIILADTPLPLEEFMDEWLTPLEGLVIFAGREPTVLEGMVVLQPDLIKAPTTIDTAPGNSGWEDAGVEVLMPLPGLNAEPRHDFRRPLVPFAVLSDDAIPFIRRWWELHRQLGNATPVLMSALGSRLFLDNRLLNEMSFAEAYHRILHDEPPVSAEDHERYVAEMLNAVKDRTHRNHYAVKLRYAAEQGQRARLSSG